MARSKAVVDREPVTRDRAVRVAVARADAGGLESLSMRKLAAELGVEAMSLYYHVKNKDDLIDAMMELVVSEMVLPAAGADWRTALHERAESVRLVLVKHQWAIAQLDARSTQATLRHLDATIGCLREAGMSMPMVGHSLSIIDSYVRGFVMQETSLPLDESGDISSATERIMEKQPMMAELFPQLHEMAVTNILQPGYAYGNEFEFGLRLILDGLEAAQGSNVASQSTS